MSKIVFYTWLFVVIFSPVTIYYSLFTCFRFSQPFICCFFFFNFFPFCSESWWLRGWAMQRCVHLRECLLNSKEWSILPQNWSGLSVSWDVSQHKAWQGSTVGLRFYFSLFTSKPLKYVRAVFQPYSTVVFYNTRQRICRTSSRIR